MKICTYIGMSNSYILTLYFLCKYEELILHIQVAYINLRDLIITLNKALQSWNRIRVFRVGVGFRFRLGNQIESGLHRKCRLTVYIFHYQTLTVVLVSDSPTNP